MIDVNKNIVELELVERIIAKILAIGIFFSSFFYVAGLILVFIKGEKINIGNFSFVSLGDFFYGFVSLNPKSFLFMGTVVLIFTPISRVVLSIYLFAKKKESKFVAITLIVAFIILISVLMGVVFSLKLG